MRTGRRTAAVCAALLLVWLLCACGGGDVSEVVIDYGESELYEAEELEAAAKVVLKEFGDFDGCVLRTLEYAGDDVSAGELEYYRGVGRELAQCAVFTSSFHSPVNGGGAWEADRAYTGWSWLLVREEDGGDWALLTAGYAWGEFYGFSG